MLNIKIDLNKKCEQCGKSGACENGLCLGCVAKEIKKGKFDHITKPIRDVMENIVKSTQEKPNDPVNKGE